MAVYFQIQEELSSNRQKSVLQEILKMYFGPDVPLLDDLISSVDFVFINIHPLLNQRPLGSKFVSIGGGAHIEEPKALPNDLQDLLDNSPKGVVYFSLGTNVQLEQYPRHFLNVTAEAFGELPYQIIWKSNYEIPNLPGNIKVFRWLPQQDLLRHANIRAFITQGGLHSIDESISAEVPMIGIPFMSDQNKNVRDIVNRGIGVYLDKDTFTKRDLKQAIDEVVGNSRYKQRVVALSQLLKDQPMTGLEKAVWYTEFVIRNKQKRELLPGYNTSIPWYQYYLIDVVGATTVALFIIIYLAYRGLKILTNLVIRVNLRLIRIKKD